MMNDNLSSLFPLAQLDIGGIHLDSNYLCAIISTVVILPTVWLRNLSYSPILQVLISISFSNFPFLPLTEIKGLIPEVFLSNFWSCNIGNCDSILVFFTLLVALIVPYFGNGLLLLKLNYIFRPWLKLFLFFLCSFMSYLRFLVTFSVPVPSKWLLLVPKI